MKHEETYVTLEQARALKRLGFDWDTRTYYIGDKLIYLAEIGIGNTYIKDWDKRIIAPEPHVAAKWLREVKNIDVCAFWDNEDGKWRWCNSDMNSPFREDAIFDRELLYETYEAALSDGITAALKNLEEV